MNCAESDEPDELALLHEHRDLFERLADSDLPISEDAKRGLAQLDGQKRIREGSLVRKQDST